MAHKVVFRIEIKFEQVVFTIEIKFEICYSSWLDENLQLYTAYHHKISA